MAPKIFLTGSTGYIGGDSLYAVSKAYPNAEITALVRNSDKGAVVAAAYPKIRLVYGTNDDSALIEEESAKADIVIHTADSSDHAGAAKAIAAGLAKTHTKENPGFWIHTSGTGILTWKDRQDKVSGEAPSHPAYDDLDSVSSLTSLPDHAWHRDVDKLVLSAASPSVKTAIVCPPTIYGPGRGPGNQRSRQVYGLARITLQQGQAPMLGKGLTEWDNVHVHDLSDLTVLLVDAAIKKNEELDGHLWGEKGYYLAENGHHVWGNLSREVGKIAYEKGYIKTKEVKQINTEEAFEAFGMEALTWGLNSRGHARRARKYLGWNPKGKSLHDELPDIIDGEATLLGIKKGHAEIAAGA